jgi:hypothetical protein
MPSALGSDLGRNDCRLINTLPPPIRRGQEEIQEKPERGRHVTGIIPPFVSGPPMEMTLPLVLFTTAHTVLATMNFALLLSFLQACRRHLWSL